MLVGGVADGQEGGWASYIRFFYNNWSVILYVCNFITQDKKI